MKKITKAVIPAAGLGTRFFPATKTIPKEMLPIVDKPTILYVIEEAVQAGIEDIVLIQGRGKTAIEDFFDISYELEDKLAKDGKQYLIDEINKIRNAVNIISIRQKSALGLGHAVHCAHKVTGREPFAVMLGDEITISKQSDQNITKFLCERTMETNASSVWVLPVDKKDTHKYGIVDINDKFSTDLHLGKKVFSVVEKPKSDVAPSLWALPGRYVFTEDIMRELEHIAPGVNGEFQLSDAMNELAKNSELNAYSFNGRRFDAGDKLGFLLANIEVALDRDDLRPGLLEYIQTKFK
ncbi:MAG: UTP--glucose-1-phosphate uridylyltransferase [Bdellovibrionaceae bacterium]|nr:UTP--glucose-1-phosphate uridylyltransferase [Pseudobdellovibrionaceae bacterium]